MRHDMRPDYHGVDFETYNKSPWTTTNFEDVELRMAAQQQVTEEENRHNEFNCEAIRSRLGQARVDEIFTCVLLVFGPAQPKDARPPWLQGQSFTTFRRVLEQASGITFSLSESLPWFVEYRKWLGE